MKIILNKCFGGFDVSRKAYELYCKKIGKTAYFYGLDYDNDCYVRELQEESLIFYCLTKDYGNTVAEEDINWKEDHLNLNRSHREDSVLIEVVEELNSAANGICANLKVVEIPDGTYYEIDDYDGRETLHANVTY
jgi:hypothetical protein